jgi:carboxypeptidase PM20D1
MTLVRRALAVLLVAGFVLVAVIVARPVAYRAPTADLPTVELAPPTAVDLDRAAANLAAAIRIRTISHQDAADNDTAEWDRLQAWLATTYPAAHAALTREVVGGHTLVYTWPGRDTQKPAIILMAHHDVVPVTPGTEGDWTHPPFDGVIADGAVWGRGAIDDKGSLVALFEAIESLAARGFTPGRTVILVSGHDEEAGGRGAAAAAALLQSRGVRAEYVLDEGMLVVAGLPIASEPFALIGVGEKGYATLKVTAPAPGGHSSAPPPQTGVETLARAVLAIAGNGFPPRFEGPAAEMVRTLAADAGWTARMAVANEWLFGPLLVRQLSATPAGAATLHTTIAPTMLRGSPKENVLPQDAAAWINYRIAPRDTSADVMARAKDATAGLDVTLEWEGRAYDPPPVSSSESPAFALLAALATEVTQAPVAPALVTATTDSRHMTGIAENVYRFQPVEIALDEVQMIHGTSEHLTLENLRRMVEFYGRLIETSSK